MKYEGSIAPLGTTEWSLPFKVDAESFEIAAQRILESACKEQIEIITESEVYVENEDLERRYYRGRAWITYESAITYFYKS